MRLVGATRWFIRWPFMIEGVVVGFFGGLVAILILWLGKLTIVDPLSNSIGFLAAQNSHHALLPGAGRDPLRRRGAGLGGRLRRHPASLPQGLKPAVRVARTLGLMAALLVMLAAGLWIGGHPAKMPPALRDVFVDESAGSDRGSERADRRQLLPPGLAGQADRLLAAGHGAGAAAAATATASPTTSHRSMLARFNEEIEGRFSGIGLSVTGVEGGSAGRTRLQGLAGRTGRDRGRRDDRLGRRHARSPVSTPTPPPT